MAAILAGAISVLAGGLVLLARTLMSVIRDNTKAMKDFHARERKSSQATPTVSR